MLQTFVKERGYKNTFFISIVHILEVTASRETRRRREETSWNIDEIGRSGVDMAVNVFIYPRRID